MGKKDKTVTVVSPAKEKVFALLLVRFENELNHVRIKQASKKRKRDGEEVDKSTKKKKTTQVRFIIESIVTFAWK